MIEKENTFFSKNVHSYRVCSFNTDLKTNRLPELRMRAGVGVLQDISLCIWYLKGNQSYVVYSQQYTFLQAVTQLAKLEPNYLLWIWKIKMKLYTKLSNILYKY